MYGAEFYLCDFHIHTPVSKCYKDKSVTAQEIVERALAQGLRVIGITDHNTYEGIADVKKAAEGTGLVVFPGFELTAEGGHIVALFDPDTELSVLDDALTSCGIRKTERGKEDAIGVRFQNAMKIIVEEYKGIAIAAHADGKKGFLTTIDQGTVRQKIFNDKNLIAMELVDLDKVKIYQGKIDPHYERIVPCIQSSDAHSLDKIGSRPILLKMNHLTRDGILQALSDPDLNIEFPHLHEDAIYPYIKGMEVKSGFLAGQPIGYNKNFNCLLGGAGSGKSTVIEFIRFALDQLSENEKIREDSFGKLKDLAGVGTKINVRVVSKDGQEYLISRVFDNRDNSITVRKEDSNFPLQDVDVKKIFPINAYSQGEALEISRNKLAQLDLIDSHLDIDSYQNKIAGAYRFLDSQVSGLERFEDIVKDKGSLEKSKNTYEAQLTVLRDKLSKITEAQKNPVVTQHELWEEEKNYLSNLVNSFPETNEMIKNTFLNLDLPILNIPAPKNITPNKVLIEESDTKAKNIRAILQKYQKAFLEDVEKLQQEITDLAVTWKPKYQMHDAEYSNLVQDQDTEKITGEIDELKGKVFEIDRSLTNIAAAEKQYTHLLEERKKKIELIGDQKNRIVVLRKRKIKELHASVEKLKIELKPDEHRDDYKDFITKALHGTRTRTDVIQNLATKIYPLELVKLIRNNDIQEITRKTGISDSWVETIVNKFKAEPANTYKLESTPIEDLIEISFAIEGKYRPLEKLSTGQKATVIVSLSLVEGSSPIIFDQPEDALYSPFIFEYIVKLVRETKNRRQFIFATHNPNIAVGAGLDLALVLEGASDETKLQASGGLDDEKIKELVILHLEGGESAIRKRLDAYRM